MAVHVHVATTSFSVGGNYAAIVQHFQTTNPSITNQFLLSRELANGMFADSANSNILEEINAIQSDSTFVTSIRVAQVSPTPGAAFFVGFTPTDYQGQIASPTISPSVAACVRWMAALEGRGEARNFFPGVPATGTEASNYTDAYRALVGVLATRYISLPITGDESIPFFLTVPKKGPPTTYTRATQFNISPNIGTQRRRLVPV